MLLFLLLTFIDGTDSLFTQAAEGELAAVTRSLDEGLSPNSKNRWGQTPLILATLGNHIETMELLLKHGALIDHADKSGKTALFHAARHAEPNTLAFLLDKGAKPAADKEKVTILMAAAQSGNSDKFNLLLERGYEPAMKNKKKYWLDRNKQNLMHHAAMGGNPAIIARVHQLGIPVDDKNRHGETPLFKAACRSLAAVKTLVSLGAELDRKTDKHDGIMHVAARCGNAEIIDYLVEQDIPINKQGTGGATPLIAAVLKSNDHTARALLNYGANPNKTDNARNSALEYARFLRNQEMHNLICETGWEGAAFHCSVKAGDLDAAKNQLKNNDFLEIENPVKERPLFVAASQGKIEMVKLLLEKGANPNAYTGYNWTPLYTAAWRGNEQLVQELLSAGADPNQPVAGGDTPIGGAVSQGHLDVAQTLMDSGANALYYLLPEATQIFKFEKMPPDQLVAHRQGGLDANHFQEPVPPFWLLDYSKDEVFALGSPDTPSEVTPPTFTYKTPANYPKAAVSQRLDGYVILEAILGKDGFFREVRVLRPLYNWRYGFEVEAIRALKQWQYEPGKLNGENVDIRMTVKIDFLMR